VGPRVGLRAVKKKKFLHCQNSDLGSQARSLSLYRLSYPEKKEVRLRKTEKYEMMKDRGNAKKQKDSERKRTQIMT
jgi:hypothetical protein